LKGVTFKRKDLALGAAVGVLVGTGLLASAGPASANSTYWMKSYADGACLDASGGGTTPGTPVITWRCNGGANQEWYEQQDGYGRETLRNAASGLCLDISGASTANGASLILWNCNNGWNQVWDSKDPQWGGACYNFINPMTNHAIDEPGGDGTQAAAYNFWGGSNQVWCLNG